MTLAGVAAFADGPVPVSPGGNHGIAAVSSRCPTFHWAVSGPSEAIDLAIYRVLEQKTEGTPERVVAVSLPGSTHGWTPSSGQRLDLGGRYAWSVRSTTETGKVSEWSEPRLFEVLEAPAAPPSTVAAISVSMASEPTSVSWAPRPLR